jgi:hypothetical protein
LEVRGEAEGREEEDLEEEASSNTPPAPLSPAPLSHACPPPLPTFFVCVLTRMHFEAGTSEAGTSGVRRSVKVARPGVKVVTWQRVGVKVLLQRLHQLLTSLL